MRNESSTVHPWKAQAQYIISRRAAERAAATPSSSSSCIMSRRAHKGTFLYELEQFEQREAAAAASSRTSQCCGSTLTATQSRAIRFRKYCTTWFDMCCNAFNTQCVCRCDQHMYNQIEEMLVPMRNDRWRHIVIVSNTFSVNITTIWWDTD